MATDVTAPTPAVKSHAQVVSSFQQRGFVHIPEIITKREAADFREAALACQAKVKDFAAGGSIFTQLVNVWEQDETMRQLTLHPNVAAMAERLAGVALRLWHDQVLIKQPQKSTATEFHQDQPYWPHLNSTRPISAWIALGDVPVERGCMSFIPGSHRYVDMAAQNLSDPQSLFQMAPELAWVERVTVPLRAGDCTFHHGRCAHMAGPNLTDEARVAHVVIFVETDTRFSGTKHPCTDKLSLKAGEMLAGPHFPEVRALASCRSGRRA